MKDKHKVRKMISENYGAIAAGRGTAGCCDHGCNCSPAPADIRSTLQKLGYAAADVEAIPSDVYSTLGCGNPLALAALKPGETVLDLGCGSGFDCFLARGKVGATGSVIGVDMTAEMLALARQNAAKSGYGNISFRLGEIEHLPVADQSVDVIISNCVINLSPEKEQVFAEAYRVLKPGGRLSISDVVATARLPEDILEDKALLAGCVAGAAYLDDLRDMMAKAGFQQIRMTPKDNSRDIVAAWAPGRRIEDYVASFIIEAIKSA